MINEQQQKETILKKYHAIVKKVLRKLVEHQKNEREFLKILRK